jgi:GT2 family glycosyltransferase
MALSRPRRSSGRISSLTSDPQISVIVPTYQRPEHLRRSLLSLSLQRGVEPFEVVVTDDGSTDETPDVVDRFASAVGFPVRFVTQPHCDFRAARCRNNGVRASRGAYLVFVDGDCIVPANHLLQHRRAARAGFARTGDSYRLDRNTSERIHDSAIESGAFVNWVQKNERRRMLERRFKEELYSVLRHPIKPKLRSGNLAVWRKDFERINGFDENFVGWGCEDDDLGLRLRQAGIRVAPIYGFTLGYHLWHPQAPSCPPQWRDGANVQYLLRPDKPMRCAVGLVNDLQSGSISAGRDVPLQHGGTSDPRKSA